MKLLIPSPTYQGTYPGPSCSVCGCRWTNLPHGEPNWQDEDCGGPCPCHDESWAVATYDAQPRKVAA